MLDFFFFERGICPFSPKTPRRANGKIIKTLISKAQKGKKKLKKSKLQPLSPVHGSNDRITSEDNRPCLWKQVVSHHCRSRVEEEGDDRVYVLEESGFLFILGVRKGVDWAFFLILLMWKNVRVSNLCGKLIKSQIKVDFSFIVYIE